MEFFIDAILTNYVPVITTASIIAGTFALAIAGSIRNSGQLNDIARSNLIVKTVILGLVMMLFCGIFVLAFHQIYVRKYYGDITSSLSDKLSQQNTTDTGQLQGQINSADNGSGTQTCASVLLTPTECIKQTINDTLAALISIPVRAAGWLVDTTLKDLGSAFPFLFNLPSGLFDQSGSIPQNMLNNFYLLLKFSEVIGLALVYLLIVTHYFKSIIFSLEAESHPDLAGDIGKLLIGFAAVFLARYLAEGVILTAEAFARFLFNNQLAQGLTSTLETLISQGLWNNYNSFGMSLVILAIFILAYIVLFGFLVFKNAKRYFILLIMILLSPIFTPMLFFNDTKRMGTIFWTKFFTTSFGLMFDLLILSMIFIFLGDGGLSLSNLILILVGMGVVADSNNLIQQIANAAEVSGFKSVVRSGIDSGTNLYYRLKQLKN